MKTKIFALGFGAAASLLISSGCASMVPKPEISASRLSGADLSALKTFYIAYEKQPTERQTRTLKAVEAAVGAHGSVSMGPQSAMPADTDCRVVVKGHWFWDLGWYQLKVEVSLYNARTGVLLGTGSSRRADPSLRREPEFMANEVVDAIYRGAERDRLP